MRNPRGLELLALLHEELHMTPLDSRGARRKAVALFVRVLEQARDGLPLRRAPNWARPLIGWMQTHFGPKGLEFARTRVEMKSAEGVITMQRERPRRMRRGIPDFVWQHVAPYGLARPGARVPGEMIE